MIYKKSRIGLVTYPLLLSGLTPLSNMINIITNSDECVFLITGNAGYDSFKDHKEIKNIYGIQYMENKNILIRIIRFIVVQLKYAWKIIILSNQVDFLFFYMAETLTIPIIIAKLLNKRVISMYGAYLPECLSEENRRFTNLISCLQNINSMCSDNILVYSNALVHNWKLEKYVNKIFLLSAHSIDINNFKINKPLKEREDIIGYVGRFSEEKGIMNLMNAIPLVLKKCNYSFILIGDGYLRTDIENIINEKGLNDRITLTGWIAHEKLPDYLNRMKLIVMPSYTEGLPNIILEAMACGTPVLATSVGAISDIIIDKDNGFIIRDNSPEQISNKVLEYAKYTDIDLDHLINKAELIIKEKFIFEKEVDNWKKTISKIKVRWGLKNV